MLVVKSSNDLVFPSNIDLPSELIEYVISRLNRLQNHDSLFQDQNQILSISSIILFYQEFDCNLLFLISFNFF